MRHMLSEKSSPSTGTAWTWEDTYRAHLDWCNMHVSCIVCNIEKERGQNLHKSLATLTLDAIENHFLMSTIGKEDGSKMQ